LPGSKLHYAGRASIIAAPLWPTVGADSTALAAAGLIKRLAGEINVVIHALGILLCLPHILEPDETIEYVSLGAGNTGRPFDLETNKRIAEFKFIRWQGGAEAIRQNSLFKDFYCMAEYESPKRKFLYLLGTDYALKFLNGGRALASVLSKNVKLYDEFAESFGQQYKTVSDYYVAKKHLVELKDVSLFIPELANAGLDQMSV
jgi:hypothetical protein